MDGDKQRNSEEEQPMEEEKEMGKDNTPIGRGNTDGNNNQQSQNEDEPRSQIARKLKSRIDFGGSPIKAQMMEEILENNSTIEMEEITIQATSWNVHKRLVNYRLQQCTVNNYGEIKNCKCLYLFRQYIVGKSGSGSMSALLQLYIHDYIVNKEKKSGQKYTMEEKSRSFMSTFKPVPDANDDRWYLTMLAKHGCVHCFAELCSRGIIWLMGGDKPPLSLHSTMEEQNRQYIPDPFCVGAIIDNKLTTYGDFYRQCLDQNNKPVK